ncbi:unnamed protein product [Owenia fusiformis]|uniref:Uncharacterized protein n=1 Tax=Owenia fusiformis TaxID=6347 RepID=A0A8J1U5Y5_OWEFU|nr:unnamed protein product [Owenia fusiformis]
MAVEEHEESLKVLPESKSPITAPDDIDISDYISRYPDIKDSYVRLEHLSKAVEEQYKSKTSQHVSLLLINTQAEKYQNEELEISDENMESLDEDQVESKLAIIQKAISEFKADKSKFKSMNATAKKYRIELVTFEEYLDGVRLLDKKFYACKKCGIILTHERLYQKQAEMEIMQKAILDYKSNFGKNKSEESVADKYAIPYESFVEYLYEERPLDHKINTCEKCSGDHKYEIKTRNKHKRFHEQETLPQYKEMQKDPEESQEEPVKDQADSSSSLDKSRSQSETPDNSDTATDKSHKVEEESDSPEGVENQDEFPTIQDESNSQKKSRTDLMFDENKRNLWQETKGRIAHIQESILDFKSNRTNFESVYAAAKHYEIDYTTFRKYLAGKGTFYTCEKCGKTMRGQKRIILGHEKLHQKQAVKENMRKAILDCKSNKNKSAASVASVANKYDVDLVSLQEYVYGIKSWNDKSYTCDKCGKVYEHKRRLVNHMRCHEVIPEYRMKRQKDLQPQLGDQGEQPRIYSENKRQDNFDNGIDESQYLETKGTEELEPQLEDQIENMGIPNESMSQSGTAENLYSATDKSQSMYLEKYLESPDGDEIMTILHESRSQTESSNDLMIDKIKSEVQRERKARLAYIQEAVKDFKLNRTRFESVKAAAEYYEISYVTFRKYLNGRITLDKKFYTCEKCNITMSGQKHIILAHEVLHKKQAKMESMQKAIMHYKSNKNQSMASVAKKYDVDFIDFQEYLHGIKSFKKKTYTCDKCAKVYKQKKYFESHIMQCNEILPQIKLKGQKEESDFQEPVKNHVESSSFLDESRSQTETRDNLDTAIDESQYPETKSTEELGPQLEDQIENVRIPNESMSQSETPGNIDSATDKSQNAEKEIGSPEDDEMSTILHETLDNLDTVIDESHNAERLYSEKELESPEEDEDQDAMSKGLHRFGQLTTDKAQCQEIKNSERNLESPGSELEDQNDETSKIIHESISDDVELWNGKNMAYEVRRARGEKTTMQHKLEKRTLSCNRMVAKQNRLKHKFLGDHPSTRKLLDLPDNIQKEGYCTCDKCGRQLKFNPRNKNNIIKHMHVCGKKYEERKQDKEDKLYNFRKAAQKIETDKTLSVETVAKQHGISRTTMYRYLQESKLSRNCVCEKCGKTLKKEKLKEHMQFHENLEKAYLAHKLNKNETARSVAKQFGIPYKSLHNYVTDQIKLGHRHKCEKCGKKYRHKIYLKNHMRLHEKELRFKHKIMYMKEKKAQISNIDKAIEEIKSNPASRSVKSVAKEHDELLQSHFRMKKNLERRIKIYENIDKAILEVKSNPNQSVASVGRRYGISRTTMFRHLDIECKKSEWKLKQICEKCGREINPRRENMKDHMEFHKKLDKAMEIRLNEGKNYLSIAKDLGINPGTLYQHLSKKLNNTFKQK